MKKILDKNAYKVALVILLFVQIIYMIYWGHVKSGYYVDEFFTYDKAHFLSASTPERVKLYDADYMAYNKWFDLSELKATLTVDKDNSLFNDGIVHNIKAFIRLPYMVFLNYLETIFFAGELNKWSGISLNILFFAIGQFFLYLLAKKITNSETASLLVVALHGFSGLAISMVAFVRFYMLVNMWMIIFLYLHLLMWNENNLRKNIVYEILAMVLLFLAFKNSPLVILEGAGVILLFSVALFFRKRKQQFLFYALPIFLCALLYFSLFTDYMQIIYHLNDLKAVASGNTELQDAGVGLINNLTKLTPESFVSRSIMMANFINDYLFAHIFVAAVFMVCVLVAIVRKVVCKEPLDEGRRFAYFIIGGTIIIFLLAAVGLRLGILRYNSFLYHMIAIVLVALATDISDSKRKRFMIFILSAAVCGQIYFTVTIPRVDNSYPEDRVPVETIQQNKGIDNLVVDYNLDDRVMYECLAYGDDNTKVMFVRFEECDLKDTPDTMLVWQSVNWSAEIVDKLEKAGYTAIEQIAQTHESMVFLCRR